MRSMAWVPSPMTPRTRGQSGKVPEPGTPQPRGPRPPGPGCVLGCPYSVRSPKTAVLAAGAPGAGCHVAQLATAPPPGLGARRPGRPGRGAERGRGSVNEADGLRGTRKAPAPGWEGGACKEPPSPHTRPPPTHRPGGALTRTQLRARGIHVSGSPRAQAQPAGSLLRRPQDPRPGRPSSLTLGTWPMPSASRGVKKDRVERRTERKASVSPMHTSEQKQLKVIQSTRQKMSKGN